MRFEQKSRESREKAVKKNGKENHQIAQNFDHWLRPHNRINGFDTGQDCSDNNRLH